MNRALVNRIADAVLYEGYILYPYRPSVKNRQRWTFGGLYPEGYCRARQNGDASANRTECLVHGGPDTVAEVTVRFLHLTARQVAEFDPPLPAWTADAESTARPVETLRVGDKLYHTWQEAEERSVDIGAATIRELLAERRRPTFTFRGSKRTEPMAEPGGEIRGVLIREQQDIAGQVEVSAAEIAKGLFRITVRINNRTPWDEGKPLASAAGSRPTRDAAVLSALVSTHAVLGVRDGEFVSLLDPPDEWHEVAAACRNIGVWPVLVGVEGQKDTILSSPIILYDYPQVAPESPGDFFDGAEIDEMLALRIMTLTDTEKQSMAAVDCRAGALLARTEAMAREQLLSLHGRLEVPHG